MRRLSKELWYVWSWSVEPHLKWDTAKVFQMLKSQSHPLCQVKCRNWTPGSAVNLPLQSPTFARNIHYKYYITGRILFIHFIPECELSLKKTASSWPKCVVCKHKATVSKDQTDSVSECDLMSFLFSYFVSYLMHFFMFKILKYKLYLNTLQFLICILKASPV